MSITTKQLDVYQTPPKQGVNNEYPVPENRPRQPMLWMISSPRFTGKTYLVSKFLEQAHKDKTFNRIYIITPSFKSNEAYFKKYINLEDVFEPTKSSIEDVIACIEEEKKEFEQYLLEVKLYKEFQELIKSKRGSMTLDDDTIMLYDNLGFLDGAPSWKYDSIEPPKSLLVMDDVLSSPAISQSSGLTKIATLNRHICPLKEDYNGRSACGLAVVILSQSYRMQGGISRTLRENLSLFTVFKNRQPRQMEAIKDEIGSSVDVEKFQAAYDYAVSTPFGSLTTDLKPFCETLTFRKNLNEAIIFPDMKCECENKKKKNIKYKKIK